MLGTKVDLREDERALEELRAADGPGASPVSREEGEELARIIKANAYVETSSKTGQGVGEAFNAAIGAFVRRNKFRCFLF